MKLRALKFAFYGKKVLVLSALTTLLAPLVINRDQTTAAASTKGYNVQVSRTALNAAVTAAKNTGVKVTQATSKSQTATGSTMTQTENAIATDYASQAKKLASVTATQKAANDKYNTAEATYKKNLATWQAYMKNPDVTNSTEWTKAQMTKFLGGKQANVTYISGNRAKNAKMTFSKGNVQTASASDLKFFNNHADGSNETKFTSAEENDNLLIKMVAGAHWRYNNAVYDNVTNQNVDIEYTVKSVKQYAKSHDGKDNPKDYPTYAIIRTNTLGLDAPKPIQQYTLQRKTYVHGTNKLIKLTVLDGKGDLDAHQFYQLSNKADAILTGSKVKSEENQKYQGPDDAFANSDLGTQVWTRIDNTDTTTWTWGVSNDWYGTNYVADYYADGNIDFAINLKPKPVEPKKPAVQAASYQYTDLTVIPSNHKDVTAGDNIGTDTASIDGKTVKYGESVTYPLTNSALPANRTDDIKSYVMTDNVQKELTINKADSVKASSKYWTVVVSGQKVTYIANATLLKAMNATKSQAYNVPEAKLIATVNEDNITINNQFTSNIDGNTVVSNIPKVIVPIRKLPKLPVTGSRQVSQYWMIAALIGMVTLVMGVLGYFRIKHAKK